MKIRMMTAAGVVAVFAMTGITHANLLSNGDFTIEGTDSANAADWNEIFGSGWINREVHPNGILENRIYPHDQSLVLASRKEHLQPKHLLRVNLQTPYKS